MAIESYRDLEVWQKSMDLVLECYRVAKQLPSTEAYGLKSQIQRSAASIPANIAEGHARSYTKEVLRYLSNASGSTAELRTHLELIVRLGYVSEEAIDSPMQQTTVIWKMIHALQSSLRKQNP